MTQRLQPDSIIIKNARLFEPGNAFHQQSQSIFIKNGVIQSIGNVPDDKEVDLVFDAEGMEISVGMFDLRCQLKDPGYEHQEDIDSGAACAAFSGFTGLALQPNTNPIIQSKSQIEYLNRRASGVLPQIVAIGAATADLRSEDITELYDMTQAGARAFSNGDSSYQSGGSLLRVLEYASTLDTLIMTHALDSDLSGDGMVNESNTTVHTGLKQQAEIAEYVQIQKELEVARYAKGRLHFSHISSARSVGIIRQAKKEGLPVSCDVSIWHLIYTDKKVLSFDSNFKILPPLREEADRKALIDGVNDGTIDAIVSDHNPQNVENKLVEFDFAEYGINGLQTFYSAYNGYLKDVIHPDRWWEATVKNPRRLLKLEVPSIAEGEVADLKICNPQATWTLNNKTNLSKSKNNPLWDSELSGKCELVMRGDHVSLNN